MTTHPPVRLHRVCLDAQEFTKKPTGWQAGAITERIASQEISISTRDLASALASGKTFTPATFDGSSRTNQTWQQQSLIGLDIDNKNPRTARCIKEPMTPADFLNVCDDYQVIPAFIYLTFSHTEKWPRYRAVFALPHSIEDLDERQRIMEYFKYLYSPIATGKVKPNAIDTAPTAKATLFYGGTEIIHETYDAVVDLKNLQHMAMVHGLNIADKKNCTRNVSKRARAIGVSFCFDGDENRPKIGEVRNVDFDLIAANVRVFREFVAGKKQLHPQLVGLASNLTKLEGGLDLFVSVIRSNPQYDPAKEMIAVYAKKQRWYPKKIENYSPYTEDEKWPTLEMAGRITAPIRTEQPNYITTPAEVRGLMSEVVRRVTEDTHLPNGAPISDLRHINIPTGIGKTHAICSYLASDTTGKVIYAHPTHKLKNDAALKILESNPSARYEVTPDPQDYLDPDDYKVFTKLRAKGKRVDSARFLKDLAIKDARVQEYFDDLDQCFNSPNNVITTHTMAIYNGGKFKGKHTLIFDEDPTNAFMPITDVRLSELKKLAELPLMPDVARANLNVFANSFGSTVMYGEVKETKNPFPSKKIAKEVYGRYTAYDDNFKTPVMDLFDSAYYQADIDDWDLIHCIKKVELAKNIRRVVVASATADTEVLGLLFDTTPYSFDLSEKVKPESPTIQDLSLTGSRQSILKNPDIYTRRVEELNPNADVISFKGLGLKNQVDGIHFGNCAGYDDMKGKDLTVVGTYRYNAHTISLQAACLGYTPTFSDFKNVSSRQVEYGGFLFYVHFLFEQPLMARLVLHHIQSEQTQAVGRARGNVIEDVKVVLIGGIPNKHHQIIGIDIV